MVSSEQHFSHFWYTRHNHRRLEHLASLNLDIKGKSVLEVGAGTGDHSSFFYDRNCSLLITEARDENLTVIKRRLPQIHKVNKKVSCAKLDIDNPHQSIKQKFDIVYCYGLLYHLKNPAVAIKFMNEKCTDMLLLETQVSMGNKPAINQKEEPQSNPTQSFAGMGCRPTRIWVFNELKKYFKFVYLPTTQPNHNAFPTDWVVGTRTQPRAIFVASRKEINNKLLVNYLIMNQKAH